MTEIIVEEDRVYCPWCGEFQELDFFEYAKHVRSYHIDRNGRPLTKKDVVVQRFEERLRVEGRLVE